MIIDSNIYAIFLYGGFHKWGTPSCHPFSIGIFLCQPSSYLRNRSADLVIHMIKMSMGFNNDTIGISHPDRMATLVGMKWDGTMEYNGDNKRIVLGDSSSHKDRTAIPHYDL